MADEMTLVSKQQYQNMLKELESLKSIDKLQKSEKSEVINSETETKKPDSKKPHLYVENSFKQLFTEGNKDATHSLLDHPSDQSQDINLGQDVTETKIPAKPKLKREPLHTLKTANYQLKRQAPSLKRSNNGVEHDPRREMKKAGASNINRQIQASKHSPKNTELNFRREKQKTWVNYVV